MKTDCEVLDTGVAATMLLCGTGPTVKPEATAERRASTQKMTIFIIVHSSWTESPGLEHQLGAR